LGTGKIPEGPNLESRGAGARQSSLASTKIRKRPAPTHLAHYFKCSVSFWTDYVLNKKLLPTSHFLTMEAAN
jgi:hypothetical protein